MIQLDSVYADATILENKLLVGSDSLNKSFLTLEFTNDFVQHKKTIPQIKSGELIVFDQKIDLSQADIYYMANGNAIVIKSLNHDLNVVMYARASTNLDYLINTYLITDGLFEKIQIEANFTVNSEIISLTSITEDKPKIHFLIDQYDRVYNKNNYKFFVKTFDKSIYSGNNFQNFQGKIDGVGISAIITDPNGDVKADFSGITEYGIYEGVVYVPENLWQRGWYTLDLVIEYDDKFQFEQLTFYVYGQTPPKHSSNP